MKKKKILSFLTSAVMAATCLGGGLSELTSRINLVNEPLTAEAETYGEGTAYGDYLYYETVDEDYVYISDCDESAVSVEIPAEIDGLPVTSIGEGAFNGCSSLASITIPDSVTTIGDGAFYGGTSLASITIPDSVTSIGESAFSGCTSLASITIPDSVTSIGRCAFNDCTSLSSIIIPDSVTSIGWGAFSGTALLANQTGVKYADTWVVACDKDVTSVEIKDGTRGIAGSAFIWCESLASITIPDSVTSIGYEAFYDTALIENQSGVKYADTWVIGCDTDVTSAEIKDGTRGIADSAFYPFSSLASITIPDSVTSIGSQAFYDCSSLSSITIPDSVTSIGWGAFENCSSLASITIPDSVTSIENHAFDNCSSLESITIPDSVTSIGWFAFSGCKSLESITIPDSVTSIGIEAFYGCTSLASITIPDSVTSIEDRAFKECTSLESITINNSECKIYDSKGTISYTATIYGYENSTAHEYASKYNRTFVSLDGEPEYLPGDISGNDKIDLYDAIEICKSIMGMRTFTDAEKQIADFDGNGKVDLYDAIGIAKKLLER